MQIPKISLVLWAFAVGATLIIHAADNPEQAAARAALMSKLFEMGAEDTNAPAANAPQMEVPAVSQPASKMVNEPDMMPSSNSATASTRPSHPPKMTMPDKAKVKTKKVKSSDAKKSKMDKMAPAMIAPVPMIAPPSSIPPTKQSQLDMLLQKYKADQISPQEYQDQRAAILSGS